MYYLVHKRNQRLVKNIRVLLLQSHFCCTGDLKYAVIGELKLKITSKCS